MKVKAIRHQFTVFLTLKDLATTTDCKTHLSAEGYDTFLFTDASVLLTRVSQSPPHMIVFDVKVLPMPLSEFVESVQRISPETSFFPIVGPNDFELLESYKDYNFSFVLNYGDHFEKKIVWALDQQAEKLYYIYLNEKLFEDLNQEKKQRDVESQKIKNLETQIVAQSEFPFQERALKYQEQLKVDRRENLMQYFLSSVNSKGLFFKYLPSVHAFAAMLGHNLDISSIQGQSLAAQISDKEDEARFREQLSSGKISKSISDVIQRNFALNHPIVLQLTAGKDLEGVFLFYPQTAQEKLNLEKEWILFSLHYEKLQLMKKVDLLNVKDSVTGLWNRVHFKEKCQAEISRARRLKNPVSLIHIQIDNAEDLKNQIGSVGFQLILKSVADIIVKTCRAHDLVARVQEFEFMAVIPHVNVKGAAILAERIRRLVEAHSFSVNALKVTISGGISEFPSLCSTEIDLQKTATLALNHILKNGNRLCIFKPEPTFVPEFEVDSAL